MTKRNEYAGPLPLELRERPQWVVWRREVRDGKPTKAPYRARDPRRKADASKHTRASFEDAAEAVETVSDLDGLGYVFASDDPFVGIDLDNCIDSNTGEIDSAAAAIVAELAAMFSLQIC